MTLDEALKWADRVDPLQRPALMTLAAEVRRLQALDAAIAHTDHPLQHFDRTCPACIAHKEPTPCAVRPSTGGAMTPTEQQVKIAAQLYDMRDKARRLLGDKYKPSMVALGAMLTDMARQSGKSELDAAIDVSKRLRYVGMDLWLLMAAAVELTEPASMAPTATQTTGTHETKDSP